MPLATKVGATVNTVDELRELIGELVDSGESDTGILAEKAAGAADEFLIRELATSYCVSLAHGVINSRRTATASEARKAFSGPSRRVSGKLAAADSVWERYMEELVRTESGYKRIRECSLGDLRFAEGVRRSQAAGLVREAEGLCRLADEVERRGVACVGDLPVGCVSV